MGRINNVGTGNGFIPKGFFVRMSDNGDLQLVVVRGKVDKKKLVGDAEQQALIKAAKDGGEGGEKLLAQVQLTGMKAKQWHRLGLRFNGTRITALVDGKPVLTATDDLYSNGMAGLLAIKYDNRLSMPYFDNVMINKEDGRVPPAARALPGQLSLYPTAGNKKR